MLTLTFMTHQRQGVREGEKRQTEKGGERENEHKANRTWTLKRC